MNVLQWPELLNFSSVVQLLYKDWGAVCTILLSTSSSETQQHYLTMFAFRVFFGDFMLYSLGIYFRNTCHILHLNMAIPALWKSVLFWGKELKISVVNIASVTSQWAWVEFKQGICLWNDLKKSTAPSHTTQRWLLRDKRRISRGGNETSVCTSQWHAFVSAQMHWRHLSDFLPLLIISLTTYPQKESALQAGLEMWRSHGINSINKKSFLRFHGHLPHHFEV